MCYDYQKERSFLFTEDGVKMLMDIYDGVQAKTKESGGVMVAGGIFHMPKAGAYGSWEAMACVDFLVEIDRCSWVSQEGSWQEWVLRYKAERR